MYKNKSEALELVRRYKLARFKAFQNRQDAVSFALRGAEPVDSHDGNDNCKYVLHLYIISILQFCLVVVGLCAFIVIGCIVPIIPTINI